MTEKDFINNFTNWKLNHSKKDVKAAIFYYMLALFGHVI